MVARGDSIEIGQVRGDIDRALTYLDRDLPELDRIQHTIDRIAAMLTSLPSPYQRMMFSKYPARHDHSGAFLSQRFFELS